MKKNNILKFQIFSILFSFILGTLLHFTFAWSSNNTIIGSFSAVNESIWEHLKLIFFPMLFSTIIGYFLIGNKIPNYLYSKTLGIIVAMAFVTVFFYTYTGIIGTNYAVLDIGSFFIAIILGEFIAYQQMKKSSRKFPNFISFILLFIILISFLIFTYFPPKINYFKAPISNSYGISNF